MQTLLISDLHLGRRDGCDVLRVRLALDALCERVQGVDRLVLLGDTIELRNGPARDALEVARPVLAALGEAAGDAQIILLPGNHDHELAATWHDTRARRLPKPLELEHRFSPARASWVAAQLASALGTGTVECAYPGLWLRDDIYATHGHYLDPHSTIPTPERLAAGMAARLVGAVPAQGATPDDYERVLAPNYAWSGAVAQRAAPQTTSRRASSGVRAYQMLAGDGHRPIGHRVLSGLFPLAVLAVNRAGLGPVRADISPVEMRRSALRGMGEATTRLGVGGSHVIFGHSHRAGPLPGDPLEEWRTASGQQLHNTGSWVQEEHFLTPDGDGGPYAAGGAVVVSGDDAPRHERVLAGVDRSALAAALRE